MKNRQGRRFKILKANGQVEPFSKRKLFLSLQRSGLPKKECDSIAEQVTNEVGEGSLTKDIFNKTLRLVKKTSPIAVVQYSLKRSLFELGPDGHNFEIYVARYFEEIGYQTEICKNLQGKFVKHEVDVIGHLNGDKVYAECKFHNHSGAKNDIKVSLYVKARWDDLKQGPSGDNLSAFYIASNTTFTLDALTYAQGTGLKLLGMNAPTEWPFIEQIKELKLYPITSLRRLPKPVKRELLRRKILLARDLLYQRPILKGLGMNNQQMDELMDEIEMLTRRN